MAGGSLSQGGFGSDTAIDLPNTLGTQVQALELVTELRVQTANSEESRWRVYLRRAGAKTEAGGWEFPSGGNATLYIGDLTDIIGFRTGHTNLDVLVNGSSPVSFAPATAGSTFHGPLTCESSLQFASSTGTVSSNTFTKSLGNYAIVPGTPTLNGIVTTGLATGFVLDVKVASGTTLVHNSGSPGSGAVKLFNCSGANIVTTATRVIPYVLDLVDSCWYQKGTNAAGTG